MARKREKDKAAGALQRWDGKFAEARTRYADDAAEISAPVDVAIDSMRAALKQRLDMGKRDAPDLYKEAADQIFVFARQIHAKTSSGR